MLEVKEKTNGLSELQGGVAASGHIVCVVENLLPQRRALRYAGVHCIVDLRHIHKIK